MIDTSQFSLEGKVALITGGSRGIGEATAVTFAKAGADIAVSSRKIEDLAKVADKVKQLGKFKGQEAIHHSMVEDKDGLLYLGTGKNPFAEVAISPGGIGKEYIDVTLWADIRKHFEGYPGGHLYLYDPAKSNRIVKLADMECDLVDLGIPVAGNSVYALAINRDKGEVYGISYPDGHFFVFNISTRQFNDLGEIDRSIVFDGPERHWRSLPSDEDAFDSLRELAAGDELTEDSTLGSFLAGLGEPDEDEEKDEGGRRKDEG